MTDLDTMTVLRMASRIRGSQYLLQQAKDERDEAIREAYEAGCTLQFIAKELGTNHSSVIYRLKKMGLR